MGLGIGLPHCDLMDVNVLCTHEVHMGQLRVITEDVPDLPYCLVSDSTKEDLSL